LLEQESADQAGNGVLIGEDADHLGAALDLAVQPFQRIGRVDLGPVVFSPLRTDSLPLVSKIYWPENADDAIMDAP
jgi:hypothetical protein